MPHRSLTRPDVAIDHLFTFLSARVAESVGEAQARGDGPAERFSRQSLTILDGMRRDLAEEPRRADEVARFLYRIPRRTSTTPTTARTGRCSALPDRPRVPGGMRLTDVLDAALDRSVVLGYTRLGSSVRRRWWPADPEPGSMAGKRVLVTGATSGIGEAMAGSFAALGATVHVLGRNADKLAGVTRELRLAHPDAEIVDEVCDVGDLDAVRTWATGFAARVPGLHGLVHNAGTMTDERIESPQGHELQLAVHVLGPHLMTELLLPALRAGSGTVVWMSTGGMYGATLRSDPDGMEYRDEPYRGVQAYARTKRMQVVLADHWARRLTGTDVRVESMHPGWVETPGVATHLPRFRAATRPLLRTAEDGADTAVWLVATRPPSYDGHFWHDRAQRPTTFGWQRDEDPEQVRALVAYVDQATR